MLLPDHKPPPETCDWHVRYTQYLERLLESDDGASGASEAELADAELVREWLDHRGMWNSVFYETKASNSAG
jgi:hypothetical protein